MAGPQLEIAAPARTARLGGLNKVAEFRRNARLAAVQGVVFQSNGCDFPKLSEHLCYVGAEDPDAKEFSGIEIEDAIGDPFPLYAGVVCWLGPEAESDELARAVRILDDGRDRELEAQLALWAGGATALDGGTVVQAIADVEQDLDDRYVGRGIILMSRGDAVLADAEGALEYRDGMPHTVNGTPVVASGRMARGDVHGVGAVVIEHGDRGEHMVTDPETNRRFALAEEVFAIAVDCEFRTTAPIEE